MNCKTASAPSTLGREIGHAASALVGGAAGGLLGNRIAGPGNRMAGTLIGAGAGALAGMAAGDAIEDGSRLRTNSQGQCQGRSAELGPPGRYGPRRP